MKHIITIQHTQSIHHTNGMVGSWTDWDLTELGKIQADHIGKKLNNELAGKKVVLYSSDLKRAMQTAEEITKYLGCIIRMNGTLTPHQRCERFAPTVR